MTFGGRASLQLVPYEVAETDRKSLVFLAEENKGKVLKGEMGGQFLCIKSYIWQTPKHACLGQIPSCSAKDKENNLKLRFNLHLKTAFTIQPR